MLIYKMKSSKPIGLKQLIFRLLCNNILLNIGEVVFSWILIFPYKLHYTISFPTYTLQQMFCWNYDIQINNSYILKATNYKINLITWYARTKQTNKK
jgi:hypothetical protein